MKFQSYKSEWLQLGQTPTFLVNIKRKRQNDEVVIIPSINETNIYIHIRQVH